MFAAAKLPLLHVPVKRAYVTAEIETLIAPFLGVSAVPTLVRVVEAPLPVVMTQANESPRCPKCGSEMILRTAKSGANVRK